MSADPSAWAVSLFDPHVRADPFTAYAAMRDQGCVGWNRRFGAWMVVRYDETRRVLTEHETFSSRIRQASDRSLFGADTMIFTDPPESSRLRQILAPAFSAGAVRRIEPAVRGIAADLVDTAVRRGRFDLIRDVASPLPVMVIAELLGLPPEDRMFLKDSSDAVVSIGLAGGSTARMRHEAGRRVREYFRQGLRSPAEGGLDGELVRLLRAAYAEPSEADIEQMVAACMLVLVAGHETTTNLIGNSVIHLLERPGLWERLARAPELVPAAIEELIRIAAPVHVLRRITTRATAVDSCPIPADQPVLALIAAANHDPGRFRQPGEILVDRADAASHLSFGFGNHYCLGARLARLEVRIVLEMLLAGRRPDLEMDPADIAYVPSLFVRGPAELPLVLPHAGQ